MLLNISPFLGLRGCLEPPPRPINHPGWRRPRWGGGPPSFTAMLLNPGGAGGGSHLSSPPPVSPSATFNPPQPPRAVALPFSPLVAPPHPKPPHTLRAPPAASDVRGCPSLRGVSVLAPGGGGKGGERTDTSRAEPGGREGGAQLLRLRSGASGPDLGAVWSRCGVGFSFSSPTRFPALPSSLGAPAPS